MRKDEYKDIDDTYYEDYNNEAYDDSYDGEINSGYGYQNDGYVDEENPGTYYQEEYTNDGYDANNYQDYGYDGDYEMSSEDERAEIRHRRRVRNKIIVVTVTVLLLIGIAFGGYIGVTKLMNVIGSETELNKELKQRVKDIQGNQESSGEISVEAPEELPEEEISVEAPEDSQDAGDTTTDESADEMETSEGENE